MWNQDGSVDVIAYIIALLVAAYMLNLRTDTEWLYKLMAKGKLQSNSDYSMHKKQSLKMRTDVPPLHTNKKALGYPHTAANITVCQEWAYDMYLESAMSRGIIAETGSTETVGRENVGRKRFCNTSRENVGRK